MLLETENSREVVLALDKEVLGSGGHEVLDSLLRGYDQLILRTLVYTTEIRLMKAHHISREDEEQVGARHGLCTISRSGCRCE
jgi:hypothetical protein